MTITSRRPLGPSETWCRVCHGRGAHNYTMEWCRNCDGNGRVPKVKEEKKR